jgi:GNAT superfamily N-acetyltransferase
MSITTQPFDPASHLDIAARLLAARHARDRARDPRLPAAFADAKAARDQVAHALETKGWAGVVARDGGEIVGFAIMTPTYTEPTHMLAAFFPPKLASFGYATYATRAGNEYDAVREMYRVLADQFVRRGIFDHATAVHAGDAATLDAFSSLGFGRQMCCAIRGVAPVERAAATIEVHMAGPEDQSVIDALSEELILHHAKSPIFNPYPRESDEAAHAFVANLLQDPEANAHWVGYENGRPVGMNTFMQPFFLSPMTVPEKCIYLFQGVVTEDARQGGIGSAILARGVEWAREQGYQHIALHFATANVSGAKFWQSSGFQPVEYGMRRHIDERIAWANK